MLVISPLKYNLAANQTTVIYTATGLLIRALVDLNLCNTSSDSGNVNVYISTSDTPAVLDLIEYGFVIEPNGGVLQLTNLSISPGEKVIVKSTVSGVIARLTGSEYSKYN